MNVGDVIVVLVVCFFFFHHRHHVRPSILYFPSRLLCTLGLKLRRSKRAHEIFSSGELLPDEFTKARKNSINLNFSDG